MNIKRLTKKFHYKMNLDTRHVLNYVGEVFCIIENFNFFLYLFPYLQSSG